MPPGSACATSPASRLAARLVTVDTEFFLGYASAFNPSANRPTRSTATDPDQYRHAGGLASRCPRRGPEPPSWLRRSQDRPPAAAAGQACRAQRPIVRVAGVADAVVVGVLLAWVGDGRTIVAGIAHPIAVGILLARIRLSWAGPSAIPTPSVSRGERLAATVQSAVTRLVV
jgi:hypothetical protein